MHLAFITLFPDLIDKFLGTSLVGKAIDSAILRYDLINPRDFAEPPHFKVDDNPYGGGSGMLLLAEPVMRSIEKARAERSDTHVVYLSAVGATFTQEKAAAFADKTSITFLCGRYEGVDQRALDIGVDESLSIGDFVIMGGEVAAMVITEAVVRLVPGVMGNASSAHNESFQISDSGKLLEAPHYTRPAKWRGWEVPSVLLSGNHSMIAKWREEESIRRTRALRPELLIRREGK